MTKKIISAILVTLQFLFIAMLILTTTDHRVDAWTVVMLAAAILLAIWSVIAMQHSTLRISPIPSTDAVLVQNGPYKFVRHPMYTSILLASAALLIHYFTWARLAMAIALLLVLLIKLYWEEKMLQQKFTGYLGYTRRTKRLVPWLF